MIIEKHHDVGDVIIGKLTSGEEMVWLWRKKAKKHLQLKKPMMLVVGTDGGAGLAPLCLQQTRC